MSPASCAAIAADADLAPVFPRCGTAPDVSAACEGLADDLLDAGLELPSVYLLTGERLRCRASRGYFQVVDGFPPGTGVIGGVVGSGAEVLLTDVTTRPEFIAAVPGIRSEACVPVVSAVGVIGAVNIESRSTMDEQVMPTLRAAARALALRVDELGGLPAPTEAHRLGQVAVAMTQASSVDEIEQLCLQAAIELSGLRTAALVDLSGRTPVVSAARGPLADELRSWDAPELATMADWVGAGASSHFPGGQDAPPEYAFLARAHVRALSVHPVTVTGRLAGLLVLASSDAVAYSTAMVEVLEILTAQTGATLGVATVMAELARRVDLDGLTGLRNAAAFTADLAAHAPAHPMSLVLIDVDDFKSVNDSFGHLAGDRLLQALARDLTEALRAGDRLYRIGGDEFAAVVEASTLPELEAMTKRLLRAARGVRTTVSIGTAPLDAHDLDMTRSRADVALYQAKAAGRDTARHGAEPTTRR
ncbi:MAG: diguanylate cyclase [Frankiales bacterium]|nr:diguanylate cyclase [Frankiales bacterium]